MRQRIPTLLLALAALLWVAGHASAATVTDRPLLFSFDGHDTTAGAFTGELNLEVEQSSGDVYVTNGADIASERVLDKFNAEGAAQSFSATGTSSLGMPVEGSSGHPDVAIDNSGVNPGRIYAVRGELSSLLTAFDPTGSPLWELKAPEAFVIGCAVAVDDEGHLWVADRRRSSKRLREFAASGSPPAQIGSFPYTNGGEWPCSIDFDPSGDAYIADDSFEGGGVFKYVGGIYSSTLDPEPSSGVAIDRTSGHVFTSHEVTNERQSLTIAATAGQFRLRFEGETTADIAFNAMPGSVEAALRGLAAIAPSGVGVGGGPGNAGGTNPYRIKFNEQLGGLDVEQISCESGTTPLSGGSGCSVTTTVQGVPSRFNEYDSGGAMVGSFGKGVLSSGQGIAYSSYDPPGPEGPLDRVYVANLSGHKVYAFGPVATGTVPDVTGEAATEIEVSKSKLQGKVVPNSVPNSYFFEWKPGTWSQGWGEAKSSPPQPLAEDNLEHAVSFSVTGLAGNTTYQARLVGLNSANGLREVSAPVTFTTKEAAAAPAVTIDPPSGASGTTAQISGTVNPREDFSTSWWLETSTDPECIGGFKKGPAHSEEAESSEEVEEWESNNPVAVKETLTGLLPSQHYCVRLRAKNSFNPGNPTASETKQFTTPAVPPSQVFTAFAAPRADTTATLNGYVNPEGEALTYRFQYRADGGEGWTETPAREDTSEARRVVVVGEELSGLSPNTSYSYRFVAENPAGKEEGEIGTFTTRTRAGIEPGSCPNEEVRANRGFAYLPECRGFELVNKPDKGNQNVDAQVQTGSPPMRADGERVVWSVAGGAPGGNSGFGATFLAELTPAGWSSRALVPPGPEQIEGEDGSYGLGATTPDFTKFIFTTGSEISGNGFGFARLDASQHQEALGGHYGYAQFPGNLELSDDAAHVLRVNAVGATEAPSEEKLQDLGSGTPEVVGLLPGGLPPACGLISEGSGFSGVGGLSTGAANQWRPGYNRMATTDASRVYFAAEPDGECESHRWWLLERDREANGGAGETKQVAPPDRYNEMIRATPDGRSLYFLSRLPLDPADTNEHSDLYRWDEETETNTCLTCTIESEAGEAIADANVLSGNGVLISDDFSHVYFQSRSKLAPQATAGDFNLYALSGGRVRFVADTNSELILRYISNQNTALSSDGNVLVFLTVAEGNHELTADRLAASCPSCREAFRYDDRDRSLECVSCLHGGLTASSVGVRGKHNDFLGSLSVSADGETVAFVTAQALVPRDVNNDLDLYEWRAGVQHLITDGVGGFGQKGGAALRVLATSAQGRDILFTVDRPGLTGFEQDGFSNLYDARIDGGFEPPPPPEVCAEESCQGPLQPPPPFDLPGSAGFEGAGNPVEPGSCTAPARRDAQLAHRARALRRSAARLGNRRRARALRRRAHRYADRARRLRGRATRCRRANRRAAK